MSDAQASWRGDDARIDFAQRALKPSFKPDGKPWYADTTREPIRDETLREGLVAVSAVVVRADVFIALRAGRGLRVPVRSPG